MNTKFGNCLFQNNDIDVLILPEKTQDARMLMNENFELENCNVLHMLEKIVPSEYKSNVLNYIAGFIQRKILITESCQYCIDLLNNGLKCTSSFLEMKREGKIITPEIHICEIVNLANNITEGLMQNVNIVTTKNIYEKIVGSLIRVLDIKKPGFLSCLDNHGQLLNTAGTHRNNFIRKVARCFITLKLNHFAKIKNENLHKKKIRTKFNKMVLFNNQ